MKIGDFSLLDVVRICVLAALTATAPWISYEGLFAGKAAVALTAAEVLAAAAIIYTWRTPPDVAALLGRAEQRLASAKAWTLLLLALIVGWLINGWLLIGGLAISDDVYAAVMQAETYAQGKLYAPAPPVPEAFQHMRFIIAKDIWISQYFPGWALILAPFAWLNIPLWIVPPFFGAGSAYFFWKIAAHRFDRGIAILATGFLFFSMFFLFNANTLYAHSPTAFFGLAAVFATMKWSETRKLVWALAAGFLAGGVGAVRPFNGIVFVGVIAAAIIFEIVRTKSWKNGFFSLMAFGAAGFPFALGLIAYQTALTGSPFVTLPEWLGWREPIGGPSGSSAVFSVKRLVYLATTTSPLLIAGGGLMFLALARARKLHFTDLVFPATLAAFLFYGADGAPVNSYGPRYLYEGFPYLILTAAAGVSLIGLDNRFVRAGIISAAALQLGGLASWIAFERAAIVGADTPYRLARQMKLEDAVVVVNGTAGKYRVIYPIDMARNGIDVSEPSVVYAMDLGDCGDKVRTVFPDRSFWFYAEDKLTPMAEANCRGSIETE
jgi:hypothetical protein